MDNKNNEILEVLGQLKDKTIHLEAENKDLKDQNLLLTQHLEQLELETNEEKNGNNKKFLFILYATLIIIVTIQIFILIFL